MAEFTLWNTVANSVIREHGEGQRKKFKVANDNEALCSMCDEKGGVVIRCAHDKCSVSFHMDCALNHGGISLMDNGLLICECDAHYKEIIFCSCKQKYDSSKAMIFCDECCDWYHLSCEQIHSAPQHLDRYTCKSCSDLLNHGKTVSKTIKEKNLEKEFRSTCNQNALRVLGLINDLAVVVCPIIDSISHTLNDDEDETVDISELNNAIEYLSTPPYVPSSPSGEENGEPNEDDNFLQIFGIHDLAKQWLNKCHESKATWTTWLNKVERLTNAVVQELPNDFSHDNITIIQNKFEDFKTVELQRPLQITGFDGFVCLGDCLKWILDFLQAVHGKGQVEFWTQHLTSMVRAVQGKVKKAIGLNKEEQFFIAFAKWFQAYAKSANDFVGKIVNWCSSVFKIFRQEVEYSLSDAEKLLEASQDFPVKFPIAENLESIITKARSLETKVQEVLKQAVLEEIELEKINEEKSSIYLTLPSDYLLNELSRKMIFLKAHQIASNEGRLSLSIAESLVEEAKTVLHDSSSQSVTPLLLENLDIQVTKIIQNLETSILQTNQQLSEFKIDISASENIENDLSKLFTLPLVTQEEEALQFLKELDITLLKSKSLIEHGIKTIQEELEGVITQLSNAYSNQILDNYHNLTERKSTIRKALSALLDLQSFAQKAWTHLSGAIEDLKNGISVSQENFLAFLNSAKESIVLKPDIEAEADNLLQNAKDYITKCGASLASIVNIDENTLLEVTNLLEIVKHYPIDAELSLKIRRKQEVMKTVLAAKEILSNSEIERPIDEKYVITLREVKNNLLKVESNSTELDTFDQQALSEVKQPFLLLQWKLEVQFIFEGNNTIPINQADRLKQFGEKIQAITDCSHEWTLLLQEIERTNRFNQQLKHIREEITNFGTSFSPTSAEIQVSSDISPIQKQLHIFYQLLQLWNEKMVALSQEFSVLSNEVISLRATDEEAQHQLNDLTALMEIFESTEQLLTHLVNAPASSMIELKEIIAVLNKIAVVPSPFNSFPIIQEINKTMKQLYGDCTSWMERFQHLLPQKVTRLKNKIDLKLPTPNDLLAALAYPISQIVKTPLHDRFFSAMNDAHNFRSKLSHVLFGSEEKMDISSEDVQEKSIDEVLTEKINELNDLKSLSEIIPIDMPESLVLQWALDILLWLKNIPHPGDTAEDSSISSENARKRLNDANPLIRELPPKLVLSLADIGLMNLDDSKGPIGFHANTFLYLKNSADYYEFLEQEIDKCLEFEESLQEVLEKEPQSISVKHYLEQYNQLLVQPDVGIKKSLEKMLVAKSNEIENLKKYSTAVVTKSGRASKKRLADDFVFDDSFEALQSGRKDGAVFASPKVFEEIENKEKEGKKKRSRPKCANCGRELKTVQSSSYCTAKCTFKCAAEVYRALFAFKQLFQVSQDNYFQGESDLKSDFEALSLASQEPEKDEDIEAEGKSAASVAAAAISKNTELKALLQRLPHVAKNFVVLESDEKKQSSHHQNAQNVDVDQGLRLKARGIFEDVLMGALIKQSLNGAHFQGALIANELEEGLFNKYLKNGNFDRKDYRKHSQMLMHNLRQSHNETLVVRLAKNEITLDQFLSMSAQQLADASLQEMRQKQYSAAVEDVQRVSTEEELEAKRRSVMAGQSESWRDRGSTNEEVPSSVAQETKTRSLPQFKDIGRVSSTDSGRSELDMLEVSNGSSSGINQEISSSREEEENMSSMDGTTSRSLQIEQRVLASQNNKSAQRPTKRPLDADAMTRLTTTSNRPQKLQRIGSSEDSTTNEESGPQSPKLVRVPSHESPRNKAPSLLEILKTNFSKSQDSEDQPQQPSITPGPTSHSTTVHDPAVAPKLVPVTEVPKKEVPVPHSTKPSSKVDSKGSGNSSKLYEPSASYVPLMRLINKEGSESVTVSRIKDINIRTTAMVNDKRVQGCIKSAVNIDGRTKIPELQRFITEVLEQRRKIVASVVFLAFDVIPGDKENGYNKFCSEFTRDQRASISNVSETVQLYVIPPELKDSISILRNITLDTKEKPANQGILYGLIIAKEQGPGNFVNKPHSILPFALSSFPTISTPKIASSTVSQPLISPRPTSSAVNGGKAEGHSQFFPQSAAALPRTTAFDSLNTSKPSITTPSRPIVAAAPIETVPPVVVDRDKIRQVAEFCAKKGVAKLKSLQDNPESRTLMPFLFEGNPGYDEFMLTLRNLVGLAASTAPPVQQQQQQLPPSPMQSTPAGSFASPSTNIPPGGSLYNQARMLGQQSQFSSYPQGGGSSNYQAANHHNNGSNSNSQSQSRRPNSRFG